MASSRKHVATTTTRKKATLEARVAALESALAGAQAARAAPAKGRTRSSAPALQELDVLRLLEARPSARHRTRTPIASGALLWAGLARFGGRRFADVRYGSVPDVLRMDASRLAVVLSAVASAPRIVLLRRLLAGDATRAELLQVLADASVGQLYHHIKELQAVGMISQPERGVFQVNPDRAVQVLALLGVASGMAAELDATSPATHRS